MQHRLRLYTSLWVCLGLCFSTPAYAGAEETLEQWQRVQDPDSQASFSEISDFLTHHPSWPDEKKIHIRAEYTLRGGDIPDSDIIAWFDANPPITGMGKWLYAQSLAHTRPKDTKIAPFIKDAWRDADLTPDEENAFLSLFGDQLTQADHTARVDRLLWEEKTTAALRILPRLPVDKQVLMDARIALMEDKKTANYLLGQVKSALKDDPGLLYDRLKYRIRKNDKNGVRDILIHTPANVPYPERWWKIREAEIRRAIDEGNIKTAMKLLANHGQSDGAPFAEALWLGGWLKLEFLNNAPEAYKAFYHMFDVVRSPVSKARAAYWAGRAASISGNKDAATEWFTTASANPTTFYGQLAASEFSDSPSLTLPDEPGFELFSSDPVLEDDMEEAIRLCISRGDNKLATRLIDHVIERAESEHSILAVARLGHTLSAPQISVKAAKKAQQMKNVVLKNVGYPRPETEADLLIERPLTLAITRQESEFDPNAESPSGALGMMQLLPATAKETAKKLDLAYDREALNVPNYNMRLGSSYLSRLINAYDGSYIMGIASYNAGPGNVRKWIEQMGTPGKETYQAIDWIEKIPFSETRNYVQRVLENMQVYRALEGDASLKIKDDLVR